MITKFPPDYIEAMVFGGAPARREIDTPPLFAPQAIVRARNMHPAGHTRLPLYARGKRGRVVAHRGAFVFPDSHAHGRGEDPRHLYSVAFNARELWGDDARSPFDEVLLELWEPYIEQAEERA